MPNMSRHGLEHHQARVDEMAFKNPTQESYIRTRYQAKNYATKRANQSIPYNYDSQDEVDLLDFDHTEIKRTVIVRLFTSIITWISTIWSRFTDLFRRNNRNNYYTRERQESKLKIVHSYYCNIKKNNIFQVVIIGAVTKGTMYKMGFKVN